MSTTRRELILGAVGAVAAQPLQALAAPRLQVRIWPGDESTRISVESDRKLKYSYMVLRNKKPYRLVLDIEGLRLNANIEKTLKNFNSSDKFIAGIRPGQFKPSVLRIVFDLKDDVRADVNYSKPIAQFGHRIIIDLEATNADTMREVIARTGADADPVKEVKRQQSKPNTVSETQRVTQKKPPKKSGKTETLVVVIDAGHGGEDPLMRMAISLATQSPRDLKRIILKRTRSKTRVSLKNQNPCWKISSPALGMPMAAIPA